MKNTRDLLVGTLSIGIPSIAAEVYFHYPPITIMRSSEQGLKKSGARFKKK